MARPVSSSLKIDPNEIRRMSAMGCTIEEIAMKFQVNRQVIDMGYMLEVEAGRVQLKEDLRSAQITCGKTGKGNATMLIWLGKIYLGQKEISTDDRISELDRLLKHLDDKAECLLSPKNNSEAIARQKLVSICGWDPSDPENHSPPTTAS